MLSRQLTYPKIENLEIAKGIFNSSKSMAKKANINNKKKIKIMKKLTSVLCALSLIILASSFTFPKDDAVSAKIKSAFEKIFTSASDVNWKKENGFYIVSFKVDNKDCSAAYNEKAELLSATRTISLSLLPLSISLALQNKYGDYIIEKSVTEVTVSAETSYYIRAENSRRSVTIKANSSGDLSVENSVKK